MLAASIPQKFNITWGTATPSSNIRTIPQASQIGIQAGAASLTDGFPPVCFLPIGAGGTPPFGQDFNGILRQLTQWDQWIQAGNALPYDSAFSAAVGGYPAGAVVQSVTLALSGVLWQSTIDNNTNNPDTAYASQNPNAGWQALTPLPGHVMVRATNEVIAGWIIANSSTIGNASSGASQRANADTVNLFAWHWNNFSNSQCPVSSGRGANAAADFAANKTITVLDYRGRSLMAVDTMGGGGTSRLSGVPVTSGSTTAPGSVIGENLHQLITGELPVFTPTGTFTGNNQAWNLNSQVITSVTSGGNVTGPATFSSFNATLSTVSVNVTPSGSISMNSVGSGSSHNTVEQALSHYVYLKL